MDILMELVLLALLYADIRLGLWIEKWTLKKHLALCEKGNANLVTLQEVNDSTKDRNLLLQLERLTCKVCFAKHVFPMLAMMAAFLGLVFLCIHYHLSDKATSLSIICAYCSIIIVLLSWIRIDIKECRQSEVLINWPTP